MSTGGYERARSLRGRKNSRKDIKDGKGPQGRESPFVVPFFVSLMSFVSLFPGFLPCRPPAPYSYRSASMGSSRDALAAG
jgi:hypothetical protein